MFKPLLSVYVAASVIAGCSNDNTAGQIPDVNEKNCQLDVIAGISNKARREEFAGRCSRAPLGTGGMSPTERPVNWLDLIDSNEKR